MKASWKKEFRTLNRAGEGKWGVNPGRETSVNIILKYEISCSGRVGETSICFISSMDHEEKNARLSTL